MLSFSPASSSPAETLTKAWVFKSYKCVSKCIWKCQNAHTFIRSPVKCRLIRHIRRHIYIDIHSWHCLQRSEECFFIPLLHWSPPLSRNPYINALPAPPTNIDYNNLTLSYNNDSTYEDNAPISTERIFFLTTIWVVTQFAGTWTEIKAMKQRKTNKIIWHLQRWGKIPQESRQKLTKFQKRIKWSINNSIN